MNRACSLLALLAMAACREAPRTETPCLDLAWVRLPAVPGRPGAAYFILRGGMRDTRLVGISSPDAGGAEMHGPGMQRLGPQPLPAGRELEFGPGGRHVMLYGLSPDLRPMSQVRLTFHFDSERDLAESAPAVPAAFPDRPEGAVQSGPRRC